MKKIIIASIIVSFLFSGLHISQTFANDSIKVTVTEMIPGANCKCTSGGEIGKPCGADVEKKTYDCEVKKGFGTVVEMIGSIIKYFTFIAGLSGVLYIIINGILYSMGGMDQGMKDEAKKRITSTLVGLVLLFLSGVILYIVAPWIYTGGA